MNRGITIAAMGAVLALVATAQAASVDALDILSGFGTISLGDARIESHTAAPVYAGGDLRSDFSYNGPGQGTLGDMTGSVVVGGDLSGRYSGNKVTVQAGSVSGRVIGGRAQVNAGVAVPTGDVSTTFLGLSAQLAAMSDTPGAAFDGSDRNRRSLVSGAGSAGFAVLTLDDLGFFASGNLAGFARDPDVTFIVNIPGRSVSIDRNFNHGDSNTIFNFHEATTLEVNSTFGFGVLAPGAQVNLLGGGTDSFVVGGSIVQRTQVRGTFTGNLPRPPGDLDQPAVVPLPAAAWMLIAAIGGLAAMARRRTRTA